jgi:hypothetical protein
MVSKGLIVLPEVTDLQPSLSLVICDFDKAEGSEDVFDIDFMQDAGEAVEVGVNRHDLHLAHILRAKELLELLYRLRHP